MSDWLLTPEQVVEFWEWCGFKQDRQFDSIYYLPDDYQEYVKLSDFPIDLNNLFRYAVPKLHAWTIGSCPNGDVCAVAVLPKGVRVDCCVKDPALALFWAIWQVVQGEMPEG